MVHVVWQSSYYILGISGCSYERAVLAPLPGAIGGWNVIRCEKAAAWRLDFRYHEIDPTSSCAKHFVGYSFIDIQICVLISSTSNGQVSFFIKQCFISEDCTCPWSKWFYLLSTLATHPTIQPNLDEFVTGSELCVDCCTVGQVNQGRRLPVKPSQSKECCPENAMAFPMGRQKLISERPKTKCEAKNNELMICSLTSPNSITFEVSKWRWWKSVHPSVLSPRRSSPGLNTTS